MNQEDLTRLNVGQNLDELCNLDPRGYGVCRILYEGARAYTGSPLTMNAAEKLAATVKKGDLVYILTGFVLIPHKKAEMDGIVSSLLLARSLVVAFDAKPVLVCPEDCLEAVRNMAPAVGLHLCASVEEVKGYPIAMAAVPFTKDRSKADAEAAALMAAGLPSAVVSIEAPGANAVGCYHNAIGLDVSEHEAKSDVLFAALQKAGVLNIAIGDLGNEIGMGAIADHLNRYIPGARKGSCACGCGGGIAAVTTADHIITATVSDWGCYGLIAALAYLTGKIEVMHTGEVGAEVIRTASRSGMIDMTGWLLPAVDGCDLKMNVLIMELMRECIASAFKQKDISAKWFGRVLELGYYQEKRNA